MADTISETRQLANTSPRLHGFSEPETGIEPTPRSASGVHPAPRQLKPKPREVKKNNPKRVAAFEAEQDSNAAATQISLWVAPAPPKRVAALEAEQDSTVAAVPGSAFEAEQDSNAAATQPTTEPETGIEPTPRSASGVHPAPRQLKPEPREAKRQPETGSGVRGRTGLKRRGDTTYDRAGDGNRTRDLRITSASLYRLSYPGGQTNRCSRLRRRPTTQRQVQRTASTLPAGRECRVGWREVVVRQCSSSSTHGPLSI